MEEAIDLDCDFIVRLAGTSGLGVDSSLRGLHCSSSLVAQEQSKI